MKVPKHFWWTKRIFLAWLLLVAAVFVSRFVWGWEAHRRVEAEKAAILARGDQWDWAQMAPPALSPENNAATYYNAAADAMNTGGRDVQYLLLSLRVASLRGQNDAEIDALLAANEQAFAECRAARSAKAVNWGIDHSAPGSSTGGAEAIIAIAGRQRELGRLLCLKAERQAQLGDSQGSVETLFDAEHLARAVGQDTLLFGHLLSMSMQGLTDATVEWVTPLISIEGQATTAASRPATAHSVRQLIQVLLDGHALPSLRGSLIAERAVTYGKLSGMSTTEFIATIDPYLVVLGHHTVPKPPAVCNWPLAPMHQAGIAHLLHRYGQVIYAAAQTSLPVTLSRCPPRLPFRPNPLETLTLLVPDVEGPPRRVIHYYGFSAIAWPRLAATALALRLYEQDKRHPAESLTELVPDYLPAVPADPFDPAGGPIRALLSDAKPRLYSLGWNMKDDGGIETMIGETVVGDPGADDTDDITPYRADIVDYLRQADIPEPTNLLRFDQSATLPALPTQPAQSADGAASQPAGD